MWLAMRNDIIVNEIFTSIDGEGKRAGQPATFIRLAGCNLRCCYCDTCYALRISDGNKMFIADVVDQCKEYGVPRITLTGGEPLLQRNVYPLMGALKREGFEINVETNGSLCIGEALELFEATCSFVTMDIKCPSSGESDRNNYDNLDLLRTNDVLKFVVGTEEDLEFMAKIMRRFDFKPRFQWYVSPVFGKIHPAKIVEFLQNNAMYEAKLQLQIHKIIWDPNKRGV